MDPILSDERSFGELNFSEAKLGDVRRTRSLVRLADLMAQHPGGSLPHKLRDPAALDALYLLCECPKVTHESVLAPHRDVTLQKIMAYPEDVLILHDSTEIDYTHQKSLKSLGQIGDGYGRGYIAQNSLAVCSKTGRAIGLTNQVLHQRANVSKKETRAASRERLSRESRLWVQGTAGLPASRKLIDVCDRGADTFEFIEHEVNSGRRFVIRSQHDRAMVPGHTPFAKKDLKKVKGPGVHKYMRALPVQGTFELDISESVPQGKSSKARKKDGTLKNPPRSARIAQMAYAAAPMQIVPPHEHSGEHGAEPVCVWVVRVWEQNPPAGEKALEWILITNDAVLTPADALEKAGWYKLRWVIEELHKAKKTGCNIEDMRFQYEERLQPMIALLSVVALTLLQLRDAARTPEAKTLPAVEFIGAVYVEVLSMWRHDEPCLDWTVHDFIMALGRMGGHLNRKRDGLPGWITLWRGWMELQVRVATAKQYRTRRDKRST